MLVKNTATGEKIDRDTAYIVKVGNRNQFFSNEKEYQDYVNLKYLKQQVYNDYMILLDGLVSFRNNKIFTLAKRHVKIWSDKYDLRYVSYMFNKVRPILENIDNKMSFTTNENKYLYFYKVVDNKLDLFYDKYLIAKEKKQRIEQSAILKDVKDFELASMSRNTKFNSIEEFLD